MDDDIGPRPAVADAASTIFIALVATTARVSGIGLLLFPELGALAHDVMRRPHGAWAGAPLMLVLTPLATSLAGVLVTRHVPFGLAAVALDVGLSMALIRVLRSPVAPAISAGLLPLVLGTTSLGYPLAVGASTAALAALAILRSRFLYVGRAANRCQPVGVWPRADCGGVGRWLVFALVLGVLALSAQWSGLHVLLIPPLVVTGFEMFVDPRTCPWAYRPWRLPAACTLSAVAGVLLVGWLGHGALAAAATMLMGGGVLRRLGLHAPPVLAIGLMPTAMASPDARYPVAVLLGTLLFTVALLGWRSWASRSIADVHG